MPDTRESVLAQLENDRSLLEPDKLALRLNVLDQLDFDFPEADPEPDIPLAGRAQALRSRLEAANLGLYQSVRTEILRGSCPAIFERELAPHAAPATGVHYDRLDELLAGVFAFPEPDAARDPAHAEQVFYQPTPARHIFALIREAHLTAAETLIDLGSGLGHVPLLVSVCTRARAIGIELEPAYAASARHSAEALHLENVTFDVQDARTADLSRATVFYLYTPFTGSILRTVLDNLRAEAATRQIRICTFGPCVHAVAREQWLVPATPPAEDRITFFRGAKK